MPEQPRNLNTNNKSTDNFPIVISFGLALLMLGLSWRIFTIIAIASGVTWFVKRYQEKQKQQKDYLNSIFYQLIQENNGYITALDLAINSQLSGKIVQEFLDEQAKEFGAELEITQEGSLLYYFPTAVSLVGRPTDKILEHNTQLIPKVSNYETQLPKNSQLNSHLKDFPENSQLQSATEIASPLTQKELAIRLNVHASTISKRKTKPDFGEWSSQKDPESIAWKYFQEQAQFLPIIPRF
ncbi:MAG: hypothetical protein F6K23_26445 [Okeania sp. SIO2C9]|uniref:hypothetical protein n=1 Tax=Okeania sp. SIO2C9 TaxID=2607791 RepID=UPI0013C21F5D|nr:hypothetical protein [Okeania sp. SIO2C9]NEQ76269.1 hypothetical protein [Okeania sp. SIO2C9]